MKYYDAHLHLPSPDRRGLDALLEHLDAERADLVGGNLILNTAAEFEFALQHAAFLPPYLNLIPPYQRGGGTGHHPGTCGWLKVHPQLHAIRTEEIEGLVRDLQECHPRAKGLMVHCFPWGPDFRHDSGVELVAALAQALPDTVVLATHGGGYLSWVLRAHTGSLKNVLYDFSVTMKYYSGSDLLRPFQRYLRYSRDRLLFGSDWPSATPSEQIDESIRLAAEMGVCPDELEALWLANARRLWPQACGERAA